MSTAANRTSYSAGLLSRRETLVVAGCSLIGILLAVAVTFVFASGYTAVARVDGGPGGSVEATLDVSPDVANRYVQTELVYISILSAAFDKAQREAGLPASPVAATQQGATNVIALSVSGEDAAQAAQKANLAVDVYVEDWRRRTVADLERLLRNTNVRIEEVRAEAIALGDSPEDSAQRRGLQAELTRLTQESSDLQFRIGGVNAADRVVEQAFPANAVRSTSLIQAALLGLIAGGAAGLLYVLFTRARRLSQPSGEREQ